MQAKRTALQRLAKATNDSTTIEDVQQEVWITADQLSCKLGYKIDFSNTRHQDLVLAWTYQRLVRYCEQILRYSYDLGPDSGKDRPALSEILESDIDEDPATLLEPGHGNLTEPDADASVGAAWLTLLRLCDNRMIMVARFLKISVLHSYRCYSRVLRLTDVQGHLPFTGAMGGEFKPRPWRRFRVVRTPVQLAFEFNEKLDLQ